MISILIPLYNYKIDDLVYSLVKQIKNDSIIAEIVVVDDASNQLYAKNNELAGLENVRFEKFEKNKGRSYTRNYLASIAQYEYLLFIDCDAKIQKNDFLKTYTESIKNGYEVICGGVCYQKEAPKNRNLYLHWHYGRTRESRTLNNRNKEPYHSFSSFNFIIKKNVFEQVKFDENITKYGHEDTLLGIELKQRNIHVGHIDNPLLHAGIEEFDVFISKTCQSVENIKQLYHKYPDRVALEKSIKLLKYVRLVKFLKLKWLLNLTFKALKVKLLNNLKSKKPWLLLFDLYKLGYYFSI